MTKRLEDRPNIVFITMDSVRTDHCSLFDYRHQTTPTLQQMEGLKFSQAYANAPYTPASLPSLITSKLPLADGHVAHKYTKTLPKYLSEVGYTTVIGFNNIQISRFNLPSAFDYAFDHSTWQSDNKHTEREIDFRKLGSRLLDRLPNNESVKEVIDYALTDFKLRFEEPKQPHPPDKMVIDDILSSKEEFEEPYFLWVHLMGTHHPYAFEANDYQAISGRSVDSLRYHRLLNQAMLHISTGDWVHQLSPSEREIIVQAYDASIRQADRNISRLFSQFSDERTLYIVSSDHGEELWERGHFGHAASPSKPRQMTLYDEMVRVPLFISGPGINSGEITTPVSLVDLLPTLLDEVGRDIPEGVQGQSLVQLYRDDDFEPSPVIMHATSPGDPDGFYSDSNSRTLAAIRDSHYKYIWSSDDPEELYDFRQSPDERENIANENPELIAEMRSKLLKTVNPGSEMNADTEIGMGVKGKLQELGYLE